MKLPDIRGKITRVVVDKFKDEWRLKIYRGNAFLEEQSYRTKQIALSVSRAIKHVYGVPVVDETTKPPVENVDKMGVTHE